MDFRGPRFEVTPEPLENLAELFSSGRLGSNVGTLLPSEGVRLSHRVPAAAQSTSVEERTSSLAAQSDKENVHEPPA
jgi:hypothetical protein